MTPQQAIDNIAVYSALHNGVLDTSVIVLDKSVKALKVLSKHLTLNLGVIDDYDSYNDYVDGYEGNDVLNEEEWNIIKNWQMEILKNE